MLKPATAFDYSGKDRVRLAAIGHWMLKRIAQMDTPKLHLLGERFGRGSYLSVTDTIKPLIQPGERLVLFEDKAMRLSGIVLWLLKDAGEELGGLVGINAKPLLDDVERFKDNARREGRALNALVRAS